MNPARGQALTTEDVLRAEIRRLQKSLGAPVIEGLQREVDRLTRLNESRQRAAVRAIEMNVALTRRVRKFEALLTVLLRYREKNVDGNPKSWDELDRAIAEVT